MLWIFFYEQGRANRKKSTEKPEDMKRSCNILGMYVKDKIEDNRFLYEILTFFYLVKKKIQEKTKCGKI